MNFDRKKTSFPSRIIKNEKSYSRNNLHIFEKNTISQFFESMAHEWKKTLHKKFEISRGWGEENWQRRNFFQPHSPFKFCWARIYRQRCHNLRVLRRKRKKCFFFLDRRHRFMNTSKNNFMKTKCKPSFPIFHYHYHCASSAYEDHTVRKTFSLPAHDNNSHMNAEAKCNNWASQTRKNSCIKM